MLALKFSAWSTDPMQPMPVRRQGKKISRLWCKKGLRVSTSGSIQDAWDAHAKECPGSPKKADRCAVCRQKLNLTNRFDCGKCGKQLCLKHRFEEEHECVKSVVPVAVPGTNGGRGAGQRNNNATPAAAAARKKGNNTGNWRNADGSLGGAAQPKRKKSSFLDLLCCRGKPPPDEEGAQNV
ncbi:unnamed protein product [Amoebophrya sp. A25]|nr:unnamed protein product [Amoebophrya sp. A25]|eukprot:GSA25T00003652001.1